MIQIRLQERVHDYLSMYAHGFLTYLINIPQRLAYYLLIAPEMIPNQCCRPHTGRPFRLVELFDVLNLILHTVRSVVVKQRTSTDERRSKSVSLIVALMIDDTPNKIFRKRGIGTFSTRTT